MPSYWPTSGFTQDVLSPKAAGVQLSGKMDCLARKGGLTFPAIPSPECTWGRQNEYLWDSLQTGVFCPASPPSQIQSPLLSQQRCFRRTSAESPRVPLTAVHGQSANHDTGINCNWRVDREVSVLPGEMTFKRCLELSKASLRVEVGVL